MSEEIHIDTCDHHQTDITEWGCPGCLLDQRLTVQAEVERLRARITDLETLQELTYLSEDNKQLRARVVELERALKVTGATLDAGGKLTFNMAKWNAIHHCERHSAIKGWRDQVEWQECNMCLNEQLARAKAALSEDKWPVLVLGPLMPLLYPDNPEKGKTVAIAVLAYLSRAAFGDYEEKRSANL